MHELSLARNIVAIVGDHAQGRRVSRVRLAVGRGLDREAPTQRTTSASKLNLCRKTRRKTPT